MPISKSLEYFLGIDPGVSGGFAVVRENMTVFKICSMPETERDTHDTLADCLFDLAANRIRLRGFIEWIHPAILGVGKSSMSKLYGNYMSLRMALIALRIPFQDVKPKVWQRSLDISARGKTETTSKWKNRLKAKAQELFPSERTTLKTADALLIAEYGRRNSKGN